MFSSNFGMARVASQRFVHGQLHCCVLFDHVVFFHFFRIKKDAHWNVAKICPIFSPWTPIWDHFVHFGWCRYQKQPPVKLKSAKQFQKKTGTVKQIIVVGLFHICIEIVLIYIYIERERERNVYYYTKNILQWYVLFCNVTFDIFGFG